jgi:alcohol dehydrogenase (NADP+)
VQTANIKLQVYYIKSQDPKEMATDYKFEGWCGLDPDSVHGNMVWQAYTPKIWAETDVDIRVTHSGICGSDLHTLRSGWGETHYPCVVGHEIVGRIVRVGSSVSSGLRVGDRVGVGAQSDSCRTCVECEAGREEYCTTNMVTTYNAEHFDGSRAHGGHADYARVPAHFVIKIPDGVASEAAGPLMCGGVTAYSPLVKNGCGPGKTVGIVGIGGIGHFGLLFAKALGADRVVAISRSSAKKKDALELGADEFIATAEDTDWDKKHAGTLDLIISTVSSADMPLDGYLRLLRRHSTFIQVGAPDDKLPSFSAGALLSNDTKIGGNSIGSPDRIREMLNFVAEKKISCWIETRPMEEANQAIVDMENNKARYRICLVNEKHL